MNNKMNEYLFALAINTFLAMLVFFMGDYFMFNNPYISISILVPTIFIVKNKSINDTMIHIILYFIVVGVVALSIPYKQEYNQDFQTSVLWGFPKLIPLMVVWWLSNEFRLKGKSNNYTFVVCGITAVVLSSLFTALMIIVTTTHFTY